MRNCPTQTHKSNTLLPAPEHSLLIQGWCGSQRLQLEFLISTERTQYWQWGVSLKRIRMVILRNRIKSWGWLRPNKTVEKQGRSKRRSNGWGKPQTKEEAPNQKKAQILTPTTREMQHRWSNKSRELEDVIMRSIHGTSVGLNRLCRHSLNL